MVIFQQGEAREGRLTHRAEGGRRRRRERESLPSQECLFRQRAVNTIAYGELYSNSESLLGSHEDQSSARVPIAGGFQTMSCRNHMEPFNLADHTGLEGYGRHLSSFEATDNHSDSLDGMDISDCSHSNVPNTAYPTDSVSSAENSLLDYGRYLGSAPETSGHSTLGYSHLDSSRSHGCSVRSADCDYSNGILSDFQGLGSYSQPYQEPDYSGFSNSLGMEMAETSNFCGYGGELF